MLTITSSANEWVEVRGFIENSGAGGSGRRGLPLYVDAGVPGLGLPFRSAGSYRVETGGGGRLYSDEMRDGVHGRLGDSDAYETYELASGGGIVGGSRMEEWSE